MISRWEREGKKQPWAPFHPFLNGAEKLVVPTTAAATATHKGDLSEKTRARLAADRDTRMEAAKAASFSVESVTGLTHRDIVIREDDPVRLLRGPATGVAFGDLVHNLLEYAMRHRVGRVELERLANWLTFQDGALRTAVPEAMGAVERVMASEVWRHAQEATDGDVEIPFTLVTTGVDGAPALMAGVIDLAYRGDGGWRVVDYKTDQLPEHGAADMLDRYASQLESYGRGVARTQRRARRPRRASRGSCGRDRLDSMNRAYQ